MELAQRARGASNGNGGPRFGAFGATLRCHCTVRKIALRLLTPQVPLLPSSLRPDLHPKSTNRLEIGGEFWALRRFCGRPLAVLAWLRGDRSVAESTATPRSILSDEARYGWSSSFPVFVSTPSGAIRKRLEDQYPYAELAQRNAWKATVPPLQAEVGEVLTAEAGGHLYSAILEYTLPLDSRRPDVVLLLGGAVVVIELKGKDAPEPADLDQAAGYKRDLLCYHRDCADRPVHAVLVPSRARGYIGEFGGVHVAGPDYIDKLVARFERRLDAKPLSAT